MVREPHAAHSFSGTLFEGNGAQKIETVADFPSQVELVTMERTQDFRRQILAADVIIYDLLSA
jgi:hypothetical protein